MNKEQIYTELQQIDEFEANFRPTEWSISRKEELQNELFILELEDHPKHFDQPFPDDWDEFLEEELENIINTLKQ